STMILPQIEQAPLFNQLNPGPRTLRNLIDDPATLRLLQTPLPAFRCPSDIAPQLNNERPLFDTNGDPQQITTSNYVGNYGQSDNSGLLIKSNVGTVRFRDMIDGSSNTIAVGERAWTQGRDPMDNSNYENFAGTLFGCGKTEPDPNDYNGPWSVVGHSFSQMQTGQTNTADVTYEGNCFSSIHEGGAQFLLGDGTVRFISENIDWSDANIGTDMKAQYGTFNRLCDRADGQTVGEF